MTCHRVIGDRCIWEGISLINTWMLAVSVSQWSIKSEMPVMVCLKEKV